MKFNQINGVLGNLHAHIDQTGQSDPPEDGEVNEMALPTNEMKLNKWCFWQSLCTYRLNWAERPS